MAAPGAIFATDDLMTVGTLVAIEEAGLRITADISVVGFDDMEWYPARRPGNHRRLRVGA